MKEIKFILPLALIACAPSLWVKPGASQSEFAKDKYDCIQQSQQRVAGFSINKSGGSASDTMQTNENIFATCLNARGWYLTRQEQIAAQNQSDINKAAEANATIDRLNNQSKEICLKQEYKLIFEKVACSTENITLQQLANSERLSNSDKPAFMKYYSEVSNNTKQISDALRTVNNKKYRDFSDLLDRVYGSAREKVALDLYEGKISWGDYAKYRKKSNQDYTDGAAVIAK